MSQSGLIGKSHNAHLGWFLNTWVSTGNNAPVCFLEGFPGTGKTTIADELLVRMNASRIPAIMIEAPETDGDPTDDLLLNLAMELNSVGQDELANAIENNRPLLDVLSNIVNDPILIIVDEFQRSMKGTRAITLGGFAKVLSTIARRKWLKGRILLLTNRLVERARWSEPYAIRTLSGMSPDDGVELLESLAREDDRLDEIAPERRQDVVKWLGGNPRAIKLLVRNLAYEPLDDLIGIQPELWEMDDQEVSADLVEDLERQILEKSLSQLSDEDLIGLYRLSVHRKSFKKEAIQDLFKDKAVYARFRREIVNRFLMELRGKWFTLHPIVREIGLQKLGQIPNGLQQAHSIASHHYTRHFQAGKIEGWGSLGGHFVEARYHLVKAGQPDDLTDIAPRFQSHIFSTLSGSSPIPSNAEELDERIAVLSALLQTPGPKKLEYHLARLFQVRNQRNDLRRALNHAHRAKSDKYAGSWLLCSDLSMQMEQHEDALRVLRQGIERLPADKDLAALFNRLGKTLAEMNRHSEAIEALKQGIERISPSKSLVSLYIRCAEILTQVKQYDEAIMLLEQGIEQIPFDKGLADLYCKLGKIFSELEKYDDAIFLLQEGIKNIPADKSLASIYYLCAELLVKENKPEKAIALLRRGISQIPTDKSLTSLYILCGQLLQQIGQPIKAASLLKEGINRIPSDKGLSALYVQCSAVLFKIGKQEQATAVLRDGIRKNIALDKGGLSLYINYAKLLLISDKVEEALEILLVGVTEIDPENQIILSSLYEFILLVYASLQDEKGIKRFLQTTQRLPSQAASLGQALVYQIRGDWEGSAAYARNIRRNGNRYALLATIEAFAWLSSGHPERALEAIFLNLREGKYFDQWLNTFIQLRLGNLEEAKQSLNAYVHQFSLSEEVEADETTLLNLWDQPSSSLENFDLAYYFPTLPTILTGLPYSVARITYHAPVLPSHIKLKISKLARPTKKYDSETIVSVEGEEDMQENQEKYVDFDLYIDANGRAVATSSEGEAEAYIEPQQPSSIRLSWQLIERRQIDSDLLKEVGRTLYDWLFPNAIHTHLQQTEAAARQDQAKLRLRMRIEPSNIASLPLEFIYRSMGGYFLATNPNTVFSRYLNLPLPPERVSRRSNPLHVLAIIADPTDQVRLDPDEWETILKESLDTQLSANRMTLQTVKRATRKEIRQALLSQKPDIIQFVGHGIYQNSKGYLALVDEKTDKTWLVDDERFANIFNGYDDHLGLICMATCESAQSNDPQGFSGIAQQLVQRGTPSVVAMQYKVYIKTAKVFLEEFYTCVAAHKPIDWAVQSARNAISLEFGLDNREFATPVLYMRAKDGNVF
ncbi:CHAT domain-containing protein [Almyronema epifaneia]|uniref:CHAT domain-containing protein n=1 Tax=Almyronema epifaneia S1 TaxID=2991925 RepID=A0ABW6IFN0_9CYAN